MALNTPYRRINPNSINYATMGQKDPWFALGYALGEGYWNNYNARGAKKSIESGKEQLDEYFSGNAPSSQPAPQDIIDQAMTISVGGNTVGEKDVKKASGGEVKGAIKPELDHAMLKWGYTLDKYKDNPNPVGDSISAKSIAANTASALEATNMDGANWDEFEAAFRRKMTLDNRNMAQQDAAVAAVKPMFDARVQRYNTQKADELSKAAIAAFGNGDYKLGESYALQLSKYDKAMATYLLNKENARYKSELDYNRQLDLQRAKSVANNKDGIFGTAAFKYATDQANELRKLSKDRELTPEEQGRLNFLNQFLYKVEQGTFSPIQNSEASTESNDNDAVAMAVGVAKKELASGKSTEQIMRDARKALRAGEITEAQFKGIYEATLPLKGRKHNDEIVEPDEDVTKRRGLVKKLDEAKLSNVASWVKANS